MKTLKFMLGLVVAGASIAVIAGGDAELGKSKALACISCHAADGNSTNPAYPKLAGQKASYIAKQLMDFKNKKRADAIMTGIVQGLSKKDMENIGAWYEKQAAKYGKAESKHITLGRKIYEGGNPRTKVPACAGCHGPAGQGNGPAKYPSLGGQHSTYTVKQLKAFRKAAREYVKLKAQGKDIPKKLPGRTNDSQRVMQIVVQDMSDAEIQAVASYIQGLQPRP